MAPIRKLRLGSDLARLDCFEYFLFDMPVTSQVNWNSYEYVILTFIGN